MATATASTRPAAPARDRYRVLPIKADGRLRWEVVDARVAGYMHDEDAVVRTCDDETTAKGYAALLNAAEPDPLDVGG